MRRIALVINAGIEYRNFLLSGLASTLQSEGLEISVLQRDFDSPALDHFLDQAHLTTSRIPMSWFRGSRTGVEGWFAASRRARKRLMKIGNFHNYRAVKSKTSLDLAKGNPITYKFLRAWVDRTTPRVYSHQPIQDLLRREKITDVVLSGYSSVGNMRIAHSSTAIGIRTWILVNSWKDLFVNDFVPVQPKALFVWSESMKRDFLRLNDHLPTEGVIPVGNPIFDRFYQFRPQHPLEKYSQKYGFDPRRPVIVYSLINPDAYGNEHDIVRLIDNIAQQTFPESSRPFFILRRNPFEVDEKTPGLYQDFENCALADQLWERDHTNDVSVQGLEGEVEWADLLYYSTATVNIASTVALESLLLGKPVLNIGFGPAGTSEPACLRYARAPFYQSLLERKDVILSATAEEFGQQLHQVIREPPKFDQVPEVAGRFDGRSVQRVAAAIRGG